MDGGPKCQTRDQSHLPGHITSFQYGLASRTVHQTLFLWYPTQSPLMAHRLPLLSQSMHGSMEFSHLLFSSRLGFIKAVFLALCFFWFSMMSQIPWKILFISLLMTPPSAVPGHPSDQQSAASSLSADLDKIKTWSNTWNVCQS